MRPFHRREDYNDSYIDYTYMDYLSLDLQGAEYNVQDRDRAFIRKNCVGIHLDDVLQCLCKLDSVDENNHFTAKLFMLRRSII